MVTFNYERTLYGLYFLQQLKPWNIWFQQMSQWHVCNNTVMHHHVLMFCCTQLPTTTLLFDSLRASAPPHPPFPGPAVLCAGPWDWLITPFLPGGGEFSSLSGRTKEEFYPWPLCFNAPWLWQTTSLVFFLKTALCVSEWPLLFRPFSSRHPEARGSTLTLGVFPTRWWTSAPDLPVSWPQELSFHSSKSEMWRTLCLISCIFITSGIAPKYCSTNW